MDQKSDEPNVFLDGAGVSPAGSPVVVAGAGSVGCFVGGMLARGGRHVRLLGRARVAAEIGAQGLRLTDASGLDAHLAAAAVEVSDDPAVLAGAGVVLVAVKSGDTAEIGRLVGVHAPAGAVVVSLQNGVGNVPALQAALPGRRVLGGMVPFNVLQRGPGFYHRGTGGRIAIEAGVAGLAGLLSVDGMPVEESADIVGVQWGKMLLNLNNALNALSGVPLRDELGDRAWRRLLAAQQDELLRLLASSGIRARSSSGIPPALLPSVLRLPDALFRLVAGRSLRIDPVARSSMWEDLQRGRKTEIGELQGAVVALAERLGRTAPVCAAVMRLVRAAEGHGSPCMRAEAVWQALR